MTETIHYQWYVASLGRMLVWARLRVREAGTAEVFDSDGNTLSYDSDDTARAALFDAEFVAFDGLDEDDALARGFSLDEVSPPRADNDAALRERMAADRERMAYEDHKIQDYSGVLELQDATPEDVTRGRQVTPQ